MKTALIWGPEAPLNRSLAHALGSEWTCSVVTTSGAVLRSLNSATPNLIVFTGLHAREIESQLLTEIQSRNEHVLVPLVVLNSHIAASESLRLLESGADSVLDLDRGLSVCVAQIQALLRKLDLARSGAPSPKVSLGPMLLFPSDRRFLIDEREFRLSPLQAELLRHMMENPDRLFTREELVERIWKRKSISPRTLDAHVSKLKKAIPELNDAIENVYGRGYRMRVS